jgi:hypothetical protein
MKNFKKGSRTLQNHNGCIDLQKMNVFISKNRKSQERMIVILILTFCIAFAKQRTLSLKAQTDCCLQNIPAIVIAAALYYNTLVKWFL